MLSGTHIIEASHESPILDLAVDASGKRLATASTDGTIRIFSYTDLPSGSAWSHVTTLVDEVRNEGPSPDPVVCLAWAPPAYYSCALLACSERSRTVVLWSDLNNTQQYEKIYEANLPSTGRCVGWAAHEYGKLFAVGCEDGTVRAYSGQDQCWDVHSFVAHRGPCLSLAFSPFYPPSALLQLPLEGEGQPPLPIAPPRMVTGGDKPQVWQHRFADTAADGTTAGSSHWDPVELPTPSEMRPRAWSAVAWAPNAGLPFAYLAAGTSEGQVLVWRQDAVAAEQWQRTTALPSQSAAITKLSWSQAGTFLLVSTADGAATLWSEGTSGEWELAGDVEGDFDTTA